MIIWQQEFAHFGEIKPMKGRILDTTVIEIEAVDVYVGFHALNTEAAVRRLRTRFARATTGGYASDYRQIYRYCQVDKYTNAAQINATFIFSNKSIIANHQGFGAHQVVMRL
jgi:hypothetical protein